MVIYLFYIIAILEVDIKTEIFTCLQCPGIILRPEPVLLKMSSNL